MKLGVDFYSVGLYQFVAGLVVTLALDALHLAEQLPEEFAECLVVVDSDVCFATLACELHYILTAFALLFAMFERPFGY